MEVVHFRLSRSSPIAVERREVRRQADPILAFAPSAAEAVPADGAGRAPASRGGLRLASSCLIRFSTPSLTVSARACAVTSTGRAMRSAAGPPAGERASPRWRSSLNDQAFWNATFPSTNSSPALAIANASVTASNSVGADGVA